MNTRIIRLREVDSTNNYLSRYHDVAGSDDIVVATADFQTSGRGQGTNTWESADGANLLFSILVHPAGVDADRQFVLSMAHALALKHAIGSYVGDITLKWPNDVYWRDFKISGTLIEASLAGHKVRRCVFGTGINVNQDKFYGTAPNPVSLRNILGHDVGLDGVLDSVLTFFRHYMQVVAAGGYGVIREEYMASLYRRDGTWPYRDADGEFYARIADITDAGRLVLADGGGRLRSYGFKEVSFINDFPKQ